MHWPAPIQFLTLVLSLTLFSALSSASANPTPLTTTIFYWPLPSSFSSSSGASTDSPSKPSPLAEISYDPLTLKPIITSYTPPPPTRKDNDNNNDLLLRIGLFTDPAQKQWVGSLTSLSALALDPSTSAMPATLSLFLGPKNEVYNVALSPSSASKNKEGGEKSTEKINVEFIRPRPVAQPHLNKPIVKTTPDGEEAEELVEKTFMQKYWWAIILAVFFVANGGGGGEGK